ncbi:MAG: chromosomal replication initiator protein DnaA [Schaalia turicensis]
METPSLNVAWTQALELLAQTDLGPAGMGFLQSTRPLGNIEGTILLSVPNDFTKNWIERSSSSVTDALSQTFGKRTRIAITVDPDMELPETADEIEHQAKNVEVASSTEDNQPTPNEVPSAGHHQTGDTPTYAQSFSYPSAEERLRQLDGVEAINDFPDSSFEEHDPKRFSYVAPQSTDRALDTSSTRLNPKHTFDTFVIGPSNRFAHAAAVAVSESPGTDFNPLFIYGESGLGKTHLLQAIGHYTLSLYPNQKVRYVSSEEFTNEFINAIRVNNPNNSAVEEFHRRYRELDLLLIDDIQFLSKKEQTMEGFFHTFNALYQANKQIVITSDVQPKHLEGIEERLRSRFGSGLLVDVQPPDLETRIAILQKKTADENLDIDPEIFTYIAERISSNIRELEGAILRVVAYANLYHEKIDLSLAEMTLKDYISDPDDTEITIPLIMGQCAKYFNVTIDQLCSTDRSRAIVEARQIAMYLCRELTELSLPKIGQSFDRDHSTVMHANKKILEQMKQRREVYNNVTELTNRIKKVARGGN